MNMTYENLEYFYQRVDRQLTRIIESLEGGRDTDCSELARLNDNERGHHYDGRVMVLDLMFESVCGEYRTGGLEDQLYKKLARARELARAAHEPASCTGCFADCKLPVQCDSCSRESSPLIPQEGFEGTCACLCKSSDSQRIPII